MDTEIDGEFAICPACGYTHGDCWELCPQEDPPTLFRCNGCERWLEAHAVYDVTYHCSLKEGLDK